MKRIAKKTREQRTVRGIRGDRGRRLYWWAHNLIAHPLLVLCPPLGWWLHERTSWRPNTRGHTAPGFDDGKGE